MSRMTEQERDDRLLLMNSIERVINTSVSLAIDSEHDDSDGNIEDWQELKWLVVKIWNDARNEAFKRAQEREKGSKIDAKSISEK